MDVAAFRRRLEEVLPLASARPSAASVENVAAGPAKHAPAPHPASASVTMVPQSRPAPPDPIPPLKGAPPTAAPPPPRVTPTAQSTPAIRPAAPPYPTAPAPSVPTGPAPPASAEVKAPAAPAAKTGPDLDRMQTVRALTSLELDPSDSSRLFAIQLAVSESDFRPEEIPNLGIFEEYRLYSTTGLDDGRVRHALRLGFFTDEGAGQAVAGYLRGHFEAAALKRVSTAERDRFAERRVKARKDAGATGIHAAIELRSPDAIPTTSLADLTQRNARRKFDEPRR